MKTLKIAIVGPESTGKTVLSQELAAYFNCPLVPEVSRDYLMHLERDYTFEDLKKIALRQVEAEDMALYQNPGMLICDTTLLVIKIWSEYKYHRCDEWIVTEEKSRPYDLFLLTDIDLAWKEDPLREHPHARKELFSLYYRHLVNTHLHFRLIFGNGPERTERAIRIILAFLKLQCPVSPDATNRQGTR